MVVAVNPIQEQPYTRLGGYPSRTTAGTVLSRLIAGLGFRLRWATEGLREGDYAYRPSAEAQSIGEVLEHVDKMVGWSHAQLTRALDGVAEPEQLPGGSAPAERRECCLRNLAALEQALAAMDASDLEGVSVQHPRRGERVFWVLVNGPISDCLTHVGQISAWRRQAGNPAPASDPFDGRPPADGDGGDAPARR